MKTTFITSKNNLEQLDADAFYFVEEAEKYGYTIGEDFDFLVENAGDDKIKVTIYEDDILIQVEGHWIQFLEGYVLDGYLIRTDKMNIENISITF